MRLKFFLIVFLFVMFAGCTKVGTSKEAYLVLLPKSTSSLPIMVAVDNEVIEGAQFQYEFFTSHPQALARLIRGEADFLYTGTTQGWENQVSGGPLVNLTSGVWGVSYLMGREVIHDWSELKDKKIILPFIGAPLDYQTRALLIKAGLDLDEDVDISYGPFAATVAMLVSGKADYAPLPEPLASRLELQGKLKRIFSYEASWGKLVGSDGASPQVSLFVTRDFLKQDKALVDNFLGKWQAGNKRLLQQPMEYSEKYAEILGFTQEEIALSIENSHLEVVSPVKNQKLSFQYIDELKAFFPDFKNNIKEEFFYSGK